MPGTGGLEVLQKIREIDPEVSVIMVTAVEDEAAGRQALELGAFDYLVKRADLNDLKRVLWHKVAALKA